MSGVATDVNVFIDDQPTLVQIVEEVAIGIEDVIIEILVEDDGVNVFIEDDEVTLVEVGEQGPPGIDGIDGSTLLVDRSLTGIIDGINKVFVTADLFIRNSTFREALYVRGLRRNEGIGCDYLATESGGSGTGYDTITLAKAPKTGDSIVIDYYKQP